MPDRIPGSRSVSRFSSALRRVPLHLPEPESYRLSDYKAPVPATLKGARVVDTEHAFDYGRKVRPPSSMSCRRHRRPANLPAQTIWRDKPRGDIPHSLWLPDTGYGELHPSMLAYFRAGLERSLARR